MEKSVTIEEFEEIIKRDVKVYGTGSHVIIPKIHLGKKATIIIEK